MFLYSKNWTYDTNSHTRPQKGELFHFHTQNNNKTDSIQIEKPQRKIFTHFFQTSSSEFATSPPQSFIPAICVTFFWNTTFAIACVQVRTKLLPRAQHKSGFNETKAAQICVRLHFSMHSQLQFAIFSHRIVSRVRLSKSDRIPRKRAPRNLNSSRRVIVTGNRWFVETPCRKFRELWRIVSRNVH